MSCVVLTCLSSFVALCVVGNKTDLPKELRKVSTEKGKEFAKSLNSLFAETSAAHDTGISNCVSVCLSVLYVHVPMRHAYVCTCVCMCRHFSCVFISRP